MALLDFPSLDVRIAGQVVNVQLDGGRAGVLHQPRMTGPTAWCGAIEAADHRHLHRRRRAFQQTWIPVGAIVALHRGRKYVTDSA